MNVSRRTLSNPRAAGNSRPELIVNIIAIFATQPEIWYDGSTYLGRFLRKGLLYMKPLKTTGDIPVWLDRATQALVEDIIGLLSERHPDLLAVILYGSIARHEERPFDVPDPSDVDLLAVLDSDDPHVALDQGDALSHTLGLAYNRHLDAPREVQVMFASRTLQEWDPTFIANVMRDGIILYASKPLPAPFAA
jgi:predicted nucleotidyltransferase